MSSFISEGMKEETVKWVSDNPLMAGFIAIVGFSIHARIKSLVQCLFDFFQDLLIMTDKLEAPDEAYISFLFYLHKNHDRNTVSMTEESLKIKTQETSWWEQNRLRKEDKNEGKEERKLVKIPGPGYHFVSIGENFWTSIWVIIHVTDNVFSYEKSVTTIVTTAWNRNKWNNFLQDLLRKRSEENDRIKIYLPGTTNRGTYAFHFRRSILRKKLCHPDLPILPGNIKENILADAKLFLESEEEYDAKGRNWAKGYAFLGPPGSGKSTMSRWLACTLNMNLCIIKQKIYEAGSFASLMENCPENSVIVIEDFDTLFDIEKREDSEDESEDDSEDENGDKDTDKDNKTNKKKKKKVRKKNTILKEGSTITLGEILNAIESPLRKRKTIFTFSSNMKDNIDPALLRPGRIDTIFELNDATYGQVVEIFEFYFNNEHSKAKKFAKIATDSTNKKTPSMAEISGCLMNQTTKEAFKALNVLVKNKKK
jgi:chaperone BCS1